MAKSERTCPGGIIPALVTPCTKDHEVDYDGFKRLVRFLVERGVHGLFVLSSTGEYPVVDARHAPELSKAAAEACRQVGRPVPIYCAASAASQKGVVANIERLADAPVDFVVVTPPYFFRYTQAELIHFYTSIADVSPLPVVVYNIPLRAGSGLTVNTLATLSEHENIVGCKDTTGDMHRFMELIEAVEGRDFVLLQGSEPLVAPSLLFGGHGAVAALANIAPKLFVDLQTACAQGELPLVKKLQSQLLAVFRMLNLIPYTESINNLLFAIKVVLKHLGICDWYPSQMHIASEETLREFSDRIIDYLTEEGILLD